MTDPKQSLTPFVFFDPRGKRWTRLRLAFFTCGTILLIAMAVFFKALFTNPRLELPPALQAQKERLHALIRHDVPIPDNVNKSPWLAFQKQRPVQGGTQGDYMEREPGEIRLGFHMGWDPASRTSFQEHAPLLTHVAPYWLTMEQGGGFNLPEPEAVSELRALAEKHNVAVLPILANFVDGAWRPEAVEWLANGPLEEQEAFVKSIVEEIQVLGSQGVMIEWGELDPAYAAETAQLLVRLAEALHKAALQLWVCVPMGQGVKAFQFETLAPVVDRFVALMHDEHGEEDVSGPIASRQWFAGWLQTLPSFCPTEQWVLALGVHGYDWNEGTGKARAISFADAMTRARHAGVTGLTLDWETGNPSFAYADDAGRHTVWFLDVATFADELWQARKAGIGGVGVFHLGAEDPGIWQVLAAPIVANPDEVLSSVAKLPSDTAFAHLGEGVIVTTEPAQDDGRRTLTLDKNGSINEIYDVLPGYLTVTQRGTGSADDVAITFDDGPDPDYTPRILDILRDKGVKATFFLVGERMEDHPELVKRIVAEGHEVGSHSYTHPEMAKVSEERIQLELNATQRLLEHLTGRSTVLFRPPYVDTINPASSGEVTPVTFAATHGYLTVTYSLDPLDWQEPSSTELIARVKKSRANGNILLLHDAGGDRSATVEALPDIIDYLRARGDRIATLASILNTTDINLMPPVPMATELSRLITDSGFSIMRLGDDLVGLFLFVATILVLLRAASIAILARGQLADTTIIQTSQTQSYCPPVSVLLPAYNEGKVICRTVQGLLASRYNGTIEIVVVDDGSTDDTAAQVGRLAVNDSRIRLIRQTNGGKSAALSRALAEASHDTLVMLDADTIFESSTIALLVQPLYDPEVAAVSGQAKVGNPRTFISRCQALEYTCSFNLDRRAYNRLNCITVVPGAVCALRRSAVMAAGGFSQDTLAEDTDLTLGLYDAGHRIIHVPQAVAWTEAPETAGALIRQRLRWTYGTLQCLWKHRAKTGRLRYGALGLFSLPSAWFFHILLAALGPVIDMGFLFSALRGSGSAVLVYGLVFLGVDMLLAVQALRMEGESWREALRIVPMRFTYRPLLAYVVWRSLLRACKGVLVGWGKLERTASVPALLPYE